MNGNVYHLKIRFLELPTDCNILISSCILIFDDVKLPLLIPFSLILIFIAGNYSQAAYKEVEGEFQIVPDPEGHTVPWIAIDPLNPDLNRYPKYGEVDQIRCTVHPGEMLYLPSLWFHHVSQEDQTVAGQSYPVLSGPITFN